MPDEEKAEARPARKRRRKAKPLDHEVPAIVEPITRDRSAGALALAAAAWIGSLVPAVHQRWKDTLMAVAGLLGVFALYLQRLAAIRADARKRAGEKGEDNEDAG